MTSAVLSPGSRNAPWIHILSRVKGLQLYSAIDERAAAFMALGIAKSTGKPVILSCTSGSALANYYPAVTEAFYARIPLLILSSDRPKEAIDQWDGQAIRQKGLFSNHVRYQNEAPSIFDSPKEFNAMGRAVAGHMLEEIPGPIHINFPFPTPLYEVPALPEASVRTKLKRTEPVEIDLSNLSCKTLVVNGMPDGESEYFQYKYTEKAVVLSDVTAPQPSSVPNWDAYLYSFTRQANNAAYPDSLRPDLLITTGTTMVSKGLKQLLQMMPPKKHIHISSYSEVGDPFGTRPEVIQPGMPVPNVTGLKRLNYTDDWLSVLMDCKNSMDRLDWTDWNEFAVIRWLEKRLVNTVVHSSSSMPIRYWSFLGDFPGPIHCNRGTSGIDGSLSTAVGHATQTSDEVVLVIGDLAYLYDINGWWIEPRPSNIKVVVLNNEGGGIFQLIDGPDTQKEHEQFQVTPHQRSLEGVSASFAIRHFKAEGWDDLKTAWDSWKNCSFAAVLEVKTDRKANKEFFKSFIKAL